MPDPTRKIAGYLPAWAVPFLARALKDNDEHMAAFVTRAVVQALCRKYPDAEVMRKRERELRVLVGR